MAFNIATDPYRVADPHSRAYMGVGAFQLLRRAAYEASGTTAAWPWKLWMT